MKKIVCAGLLMVMLGTSGVYSGTTARIQGLIINSSGASIEIKKGRKEVTLYWIEGSKVLMNGKEADRAAVEICQKAEATYAVRNGRRELVTLEILKESYCKK